jgi:hypothetical protein
MSISMPQNANFMLRQGQDCLGFCEASSMERLLNEQVLIVQIQAFTQIAGKPWLEKLSCRRTRQQNCPIRGNCVR